ncbi:uncharacterized protein LOC113384454 [Ctenocephalides felis]|uniref:uncharacterized protein LOC113384454 n=1 Tax=Ctenocephalides felis TaxID=7515 RepID=UPI000E6E5A4B|nr:uncharacterized protein LOC113384454 [Ctenocephalides felis]
MFRALNTVRNSARNLARRYGTPPPPCENEPCKIPLKPVECFDMSLNDMPSPKGCWHKKNKELQTYYNKVFIVGVIVLLSGIAGVYANVDFYAGVADKPAPRS